MIDFPFHFISFEFIADQIGFDAADLERDLINERLQKDVVGCSCVLWRWRFPRLTPVNSSSKYLASYIFV
jgi:hypothetical protein